MNEVQEVSNVVKVKDIVKYPNKKCTLCHGRGFFVSHVTEDKNVIYKTKYVINKDTKKKERIVTDSNSSRQITLCGCLIKGLTQKEAQDLIPEYVVQDGINITVLVKKE